MGWLVAQEAFTKAHRSFGQLRDRERFRAWLVRMTWRLAINFKRGEKRRAGREERQAVEYAAREQHDEADSRDRVAEIWRAIFKDGQSAQFSTATDKITGETTKIDVSVKVAGGLPRTTHRKTLSEWNAGQTVGKRALGLRVISESGGQISLGQAFARQLPLLTNPDDPIL